MQGLLEVAAQGGIRAGTLMIAAGGLALYQMTSLVLGPAGSRELHVSLAIPTVDADGLWDAGQSSINQVVLGVAVAVTPAPPSAPASRQTLRRSAQPQATASAAPAPIVATRPAPPVPTDAPVTHVKGHPQPPKHHESD